MNEKFFSLPAEKQQRIINAGFRVFSKNSYRKSPVNEVAQEAGISKSLLFHYFHNKKELYLFLWETCAQMTMEALRKSGCYEQKDLFDTLYIGVLAKARIMRQYPELGLFAVKAYYEKDPEVCLEIQRSVGKYTNFQANTELLNLDPAQFIPGLDLEMMYREMCWSTEGYLWEWAQRGNLDVDRMERDFRKLIDFWKSVYLRKEG